VSVKNKFPFLQSHRNKNLLYDNSVRSRPTLSDVFSFAWVCEMVSGDFCRPFASSRMLLTQPYVTMWTFHQGPKEVWSNEVL